MRQIFPLGDYVRRTGDTMTGNLNMGNNAIVFSGGLIKNTEGYLDSRDPGDAVYRSFRGAYYLISSGIEGIGGASYTLKHAIPQNITLALILAWGG